jgi:hypothetical protein
MSVSKVNRVRFKSLVRKIKQWLYSWMRPGYVESDDEYKISKLLLLQFICSAAALSACDGNVQLVLCILKFLQGHVFVHEALYLHYLFKLIRNYDVAHGVQHEVRPTTYIFQSIFTYIIYSPFFIFIYYK